MTGFVTAALAGGSLNTVQLVFFRFQLIYIYVQAPKAWTC